MSGQNCRWQPPCLNWLGRELQWLNGIHSTHDTWRGCSSVTTHFLRAVSARNEFIPVKTAETIRCLTSTTEVGETSTPLVAGEDADAFAAADVGLEEGELEQLFAEHGENEDAAGTR
uniref:ORF2 n=1 Tax=Gorilla anellovirus TaxID=1743411 RepID=A0A0S2GMK4_9VIRU|nr:ORF2 [Gorilla anellovirus]